MQRIISISFVFLVLCFASLAYAVPTNSSLAVDKLLQFDDHWQQADPSPFQPRGDSFALNVQVGTAYRMVFPAKLDGESPIVIHTKYGPVKQFLHSPETYHAERVGRYLIYHGKNKSILFRYDQNQKAFREFVYLPDSSSLQTDGTVIQWRFEGIKLDPKEDGSVEVLREESQNAHLATVTNRHMAHRISKFLESRYSGADMTRHTLFRIPPPVYIDATRITQKEGIEYEVKTSFLTLALNNTKNLTFPLWVDPSFETATDASIIIGGQSAQDHLGTSVSLIGDFNGDGLDDVIVGANTDDNNGENNSGSAFIFFGRDPATQLQLRADAGADVILDGQSAGDQFGISTASAGDFNGDGYDDVIVGAYRDDTIGTPGGGTQAGRAFIFFGRNVSGQLHLRADVDANVIINGQGSSSLGRSVSSAGDFNGDGLNDVIVGAEFGRNNGGFFIGNAFVFFGRTVTSQLVLQAKTDADVILNGQSANDMFGIAVSSAGDFNGDGKDEVIVGARDDDNGEVNSGSAFIFFGRTTSIQLSLTADADADVILDGQSPAAGAGGDWFGTAVAPAGDFNGDGYDDVIVGALQNGNNGEASSGSAYIFFGRTLSAQLRLLADADGDVILDGQNAGDFFGTSVASVGDINGDGFNDVIVGATGDDNTGSNAGSAFVFLGRSPANQLHLRADTGAFFILNDSLNQFGNFGRSVSSAGDFNGDGKLDFIVGGPDADAQGGGGNSGETFIFLNLEAPDLIFTANAGSDQTVNEGTLVQLDGTGSFHSQSVPLNFTWTQISGPAVTLNLTDPSQPTFAAPFVTNNQNLTFELIVDDGTNFSQPDDVDIVVLNANTAPEADAGDDSTVKPGALAVLDGSHSFDPDNDPLSFQWTQVAGTSVMLDVSDPARPTFTGPNAVGDVLVFKLQVSDGEESSTPSPGSDSSQADTVAVTIVENSRPVADAGPDQTKDEGSLVTLNGTGSSDADGGDILSYQWTQTGGISVLLSDATSPAPTFTAPFVGTGGADLTFELVVTDNDSVNPLSSVSSGMTVHVANINDPPSCSTATASLDLGWPPNHKMELVEIENLADPENDGITVQITGVTQDEPVSGLSNGDSSPDAVIQSVNTADSILLRLERDPQSNGRVYVVRFTASDGIETCEGSIEVIVPHSRKSGAINDGQLYDSTQP